MYEKCKAGGNCEIAKSPRYRKKHFLGKLMEEINKRGPMIAIRYGWKR